MKDFWQKLKKPIFCLAPMEDVTDTVFRQIIASVSPPDVFFTEFTNIDGLFSKGKDKVITRLLYTKKENPIIAQVWGINPDLFYKAGKLIEEMGFDGIDINMGCPQRKIIKNGSCSALIKNHKLASEIINATKKGVKNIPLCVKTRIGFNTIETDSWITFLLKQDIDCLVIHGRTVKEMSDVPVHWDEIKKAADIRNSLNKSTIIIGNGDIKSYQDGMEYTKKYGTDGVMIGRGIFSNPWFFNPQRNALVNDPKTMLALLLTHMKLFNKTWGHSKNFAIMKKFYKMYISNFTNAKTLREELNQLHSPLESIEYLEKYIQSL